MLLANPWALWRVWWGNYLNPQAQWLVDQIVSNRVPDSRAGCALGLASIYSHVGGPRCTVAQDDSQRAHVAFYGSSPCCSFLGNVLTGSSDRLGWSGLLTLR